MCLNLQFPVDGDKLMEVVDVVSSVFFRTAHGRHYGQMFCFSSKIMLGVMSEIVRLHCIISLHSSFLSTDYYFFAYLCFKECT